MVAQCFNGLNVYGKQPEQLVDLVRLFNFVLADYSATEIIPAFRLFLSRNSRMPTPADIAAIIRRGGKPPLDQAVYIALVEKKKRTAFVDAGSRGDGLSVQEDDYVKAYEADAIGGQS